MPEINEKNIGLWAKMGQNGAFGLAALQIAAENDDTVFLTADLGVYSGLSRLAASYPDRYFNTGIAEQNMLGIAGGMAAEGRIPFAVTYASFAAMRCADQIRVIMGEMRLPVKLAGTGAGFSIAHFGPTHMGLEDIAVMRAIPGITIFSPADSLETIKAAQAMARSDGPAYMRLNSVPDAPAIYAKDYEFEPGKAIRLLPGKDIVFIATGSMVSVALKAAESLRAHNLGAGVFNMHTIRPLDDEAIISACGAGIIATLEEHSITGGLGSAVAEVLAAMRRHPPLLRFGARTYPEAAPRNHLLGRCGLGADQIVARILEFLKKAE